MMKTTARNSTKKKIEFTDLPYMYVKCGDRCCWESSGGKEGGDRCWCEVCLGRLVRCVLILIVRVMEDGREKWRFGLETIKIYTVVYVTATEK
jgi:hypothetical protein